MRRHRTRRFVHWLGSWIAAWQMLTQKFRHGAPIYETLWSVDALVSVDQL